MTVPTVDVGLLHLIEELARVGGQGLYVTALAFGKERIEGERRFARPGDAGDDHQPVAGNRDIDVGEVVLPRTANDDFILHPFRSASISRLR